MMPVFIPSHRYLLDRGRITSTVGDCVAVIRLARGGTLHRAGQHRLSRHTVQRRVVAGCTAAALLC
jgi:hypothetical protein